MNFLRMIYHNFRYGAASTVIFIDNQVDAALAAMVRAVVFVFGLVAIGTIIGWLGFPRAAQYIYAVGYFVGGSLSLILAARMGVLITAFPLAYDLVRRIVRETTEALPGVNGVNLPEILTQQNASWIYRVLWATLATLQMVSCYAIVFPIYTNPLSFLVVLGAGWAILYGALTVGVGNTWLTRYGYLNVGIGISMIIAYTLTFPFPNIWINFGIRWNGMWTSFGEWEALTAVHYFAAVLYFVVVVGSIISVAYAIVRKGQGIAVAVLFLVALLFMIILGPRTATALSTPVSPDKVTTSFSSSSVPSSQSFTRGDGETFVDAKSYNGVDSGIDLKAGDKWQASASGTAVWKNISVGNPTKYEETGPDGTSPTASPLMTPSEYWSNIDQYLCPKAKKGALIAKIGDGEWFSVGSNYKGEAKTSGRLVFAVNDLDPQKQSVSNWQDNDKGFTVAVKK
jgi:hypothetical protein